MSEVKDDDKTVPKEAKVLRPDFGKGRSVSPEGDTDDVDAVVPTTEASEQGGELLEISDARLKTRIRQMLFFVKFFATVSPDHTDGGIRMGIPSMFLHEMAEICEQNPKFAPMMAAEAPVITKLIERMLASGESRESFQTPSMQNFMHVVSVAMPTAARIDEVKEELRPKSAMEKRDNHARAIGDRILEVLYSDSNKDIRGIRRFLYTFVSTAMRYVEKNRGKETTDQFNMDDEISREWIVTNISEEIKAHPDLEEDVWKIFELLWMSYKLPQKAETIDDISERLGRPNAKKVRRKCHYVSQWMPDIKSNRWPESTVLQWMFDMYQREFSAEEKAKYGEQIVSEIKRYIAYWELDDFFFKRMSDYFKARGEKLAA